jgi:DNA helicase-2/ATP-dependent DNA helicase PcrA
MTRAKDELALVVPQRFYVHGQPRNGDRSVYAARTRFIPPPLLTHFERQTWPEAELAPQRRASDGPRVDLQARMRAMWR